MIGIYMITNKNNKKSYIGQSIHCGKRLEEHYGGHKDQFIDDIIQIEGIENFDFKILKQVGEEDLSYWEDYFILKYNTFFPNGYNKKWNTAPNIRNSIELKIKQEQEQKQIDNSEDYLNLSEEQICYIFNETMFDIYLRLISLSVWVQDSYQVDSRQVMGVNLKQYFPNITYATLLKYIKILKENNILIKKGRITFIKDIPAITKYIEKKEYELLTNKIAIYWYIKQKSLNMRQNDFFGQDFRWIFSMNSFGAEHYGNKQLSYIREVIKEMEKLGLLFLSDKTGVYRMNIKII